MLKDKEIPKVYMQIAILALLAVIACSTSVTAYYSYSIYRLKYRDDSEWILKGIAQNIEAIKINTSRTGY